MKKNLFILCAIAALGCVASCTPTTNPDDPTPGKDNKTVKVSISADQKFAEDNTAKLTVTLSEAAASEVVVKLAKADPQSGKAAVPADFDKKVKIAAGATTAEVAVKADVLGLEPGEYQAAIKIDSAEGAEVAEPSVAYIAFSYEYKPEVNLYADQQFGPTCTANVKVVIPKATNKDVKVAVALDAASTAKVTIPSEVTIAAGQTEAEFTATADITGIEAGNYTAIINITSVEGGLVGGSKSATITLQYPFSVSITIDGSFDDWAGAVAFDVPEDAEFKGFRTMKLAATDKRMFVYFEIVEPVPSDFGMYPMPIDIFIDCDANVNTGGKLTSTDNINTTLPYTDSGLNWYIELGNVHDGQGYTDFTWGAYKYTGADGGSIWSLENMTGKYGASECFGVGVLGEDGIGRIEIMFDRKFFMLTNTVASVGAKVMNGNDGWSCYGLVPFGHGSTRADLGVINMPVYSEN